MEATRSTKGWNCPEVQPFIEESINDAAKLYFGSESLCKAEGGTIPLMGKLVDMWPEGQFVITGVLGPNSNAHGPNEFLHLAYVKKLICCMSFILNRAGEHYKA